MFVVRERQIAAITVRLASEGTRKLPAAPGLQLELHFHETDVTIAVGVAFAVLEFDCFIQHISGVYFTESCSPDGTSAESSRMLGGRNAD